MTMADLSTENESTFLLNLHKSIEESANTNANHIMHGRLNQLINYPPNGGLTGEEINALMALGGQEQLKSALRKVLASTTADVFFDVFNLIDGTADPDPGTGQWTGVMMIDKPEDLDEDGEFLHDRFYATYWDWKEKRQNTNWSLDNAT
jgi:hypothetical protein